MIATAIGVALIATLIVGTLFVANRYAVQPFAPQADAVSTVGQPKTPLQTEAYFINGLKSQPSASDEWWSARSDHRLVAYSVWNASERFGTHAVKPPSPPLAGGGKEFLLFCVPVAGFCPSRRRWACHAQARVRAPPRLAWRRARVPRSLVSEAASINIAIIYLIFRDCARCLDCAVHRVSANLAAGGKIGDFQAIGGRRIALVV
jgi:hypothetical protein